MKKILLVGLMAAATLITSCNKDDGTDINSGETSNVFVAVTTPGTGPGTRAEANRVVNDPIALDEGYIFFTLSNGVISRYVEIKNTPSGVNDVDLNTLRSTGVTVPNVPSSSQKAYIISKIPSGITFPVITPNVTNISEILALPVEVDDLHDSADGIANVPLWGEGNVAYNIAGTGLETDISVKAIGSRIQIGKITGKNDIQEYELDGIFINNYFRQMPFSMTLSASSIVDNLSDNSKYTSAVYDAAGAHYLYDETGSPLGQFAGSQTLECTPATGSVWAYNVLPTVGVPSADPTTIPHVVIRLTNVEYFNGVSNVTVPGPLFLTVSGMSQGSVLLDEIENGKAYTFEDIQFEYSDLTTTPEVKQIDATVTVTEVPWAEEIVDPEL